VNRKKRKDLKDSEIIVLYDSKKKIIEFLKNNKSEIK